MVFAQGAVMQTHPGRPDMTDLFQPNGGMPGIGLEQLKVFIGQFANGRGQLAVVLPEFRRGEVVQSGLQRPAS